MEVPAKHTPCSAQDIVTALCAIWPSEMGGDDPPALSTACVLAAQWALETQHGQNMFCFNIGNAKRPDPRAGDYCSFPTFEIIKGVRTNIVPPDVGCRFAAFATLEDGVRAWLRDFYSRWTLAWHAACAGDPEGFAQGLHDQQPPYYTGHVEDYRAGVRGYFNHYFNTLRVGAPGAPISPLASADTKPTVS